jgi:hypothetical protein
VSERDPLLSRLAGLPAVSPPARLSRKLTATGHARLVPAKVHPVFSMAVAASVLTYLAWALHFTSQLF